MTPHDFIAKWNGEDGSECANFPMFFSELCDLLGVERPQPAQADNWHNGYFSERYIAARFAGKRGLAKPLPGLLAALEAVARARGHADGTWSAV